MSDQAVYEVADSDCILIIFLERKDGNLFVDGVGGTFGDCDA